MNPTGWFKFTCGADIVADGTKLEFAIVGEDADYYMFANDDTSISPVAPYAETENEPGITTDTSLSKV